MKVEFKLLRKILESDDFKNDYLQRASDLTGAIAYLIELGESLGGVRGQLTDVIKAYYQDYTQDIDFDTITAEDVYNMEPMEVIPYLACLVANKESLNLKKLQTDPALKAVFSCSEQLIEQINIIVEVFEFMCEQI